ncbi:hypothetical protein TKK_0016285 [Trichogramma kaykai]
MGIVKRFINVTKQALGLHNQHRLGSSSSRLGRWAGNFAADDDDGVSRSSSMFSIRSNILGNGYNFEASSTPRLDTDFVVTFNFN